MIPIRTSKQPSQRIAIIGAGPGGLAAAYALRDCGAEVTVFEATDKVGGSTAGTMLWNRALDSASFFLHPGKYPEVEGLFREFGSLHAFKRESAVYTGKRRFPFPAMTGSLIQKLDPAGMVLATGSYVASQLPLFRNSSAAGTYSRKHGSFLRRQLLDTYWQKRWGVPSKQLGRGYREFPSGRSSSQQQPRISGADAILPEGGLVRFFQKLSEELQNSGVEIRFSRRIKAVGYPGDGSLALFSESSEGQFDEVICTTALPSLIEALPDVPSRVLTSARSIEFRAVRRVYLELGQIQQQREQLLLLNHPRIQAARLLDFTDLPGMEVESHRRIVCLEYWMDRREFQARAEDDHWINQASADLKLIPAYKDASMLNASVIGVASASPVYDHHFYDNVSRIRRYVDSIPSLHVAGRAGSLRVNMDVQTSIVKGLRKARQIRTGIEKTASLKTA